MKARILIVLSIFCFTSPSVSFAAWGITLNHAIIGVTLANPGSRTAFTSRDWIHRGTAYNIDYYLGTAGAAIQNVTVTSAPATVLLTRTGGTETATATIAYRTQIGAGAAKYPESAVDGVVSPNPRNL